MTLPSKDGGSRTIGAVDAAVVERVVGVATASATVLAPLPADVNGRVADRPGQQDSGHALSPDGPLRLVSSLVAGLFELYPAAVSELELEVELDAFGAPASVPAALSWLPSSATRADSATGTVADSPAAPAVGHGLS